MISFSLKFEFSSLSIADAITSEYLIHPNHPLIIHLLASFSDCSKQNNLRQFSLARVQICTQTASEVEYARTFAAVLICAEAKRLKAFSCSATVRKDVNFCAQSAHHRKYRHERIDWHTKSLPLPKKLETNEKKRFHSKP